MSIEYRGTPDPKRQRLTRRYAPDGGYVESSDWSSFSEAQILAMFNWAAGRGIEAEMTSRMGRHELTLTDSRGLTRVDRWDVGVSEEQPNILQNPYLDVSVGGEVVSDWEKFVIGIALKKGISLTEAVENEQVVDKYGTFPVSIFTDRGIRIYEKCVNNQTQYQTGRLVLRHSTTVSNRYDSNISEFNENCVYLHADFLSEVLSTSLWIFPLPGRLEFKCTSFHNRHEPPARPFHTWGWLKSVSPETSVSNNLVEIQTLYKLDQWSDDFNAPAT